MTYEQAQLYIKLFILQHYDENIADVIPLAGRSYGRVFGKVSELFCDWDGDWGNDKMVIFWANEEILKQHNKICFLATTNKNTINILDYVNLEEES